LRIYEGFIQYVAISALGNGFGGLRCRNFGIWVVKLPSLGKQYVRWNFMQERLWGMSSCMVSAEIVATKAAVDTDGRLEFY